MLSLGSKYAAMGKSKKYSVSKPEVIQAKEPVLLYGLKATGISNRITQIRKGLPVTLIEDIASLIQLSTKELLVLLGIPQTTFNKKKRAQELLTPRDTELLLHIQSVVNYGISVFNNEGGKFMSYLHSVNPGLGGVTPISLFDSNTGVEQVHHQLNAINYGNMA
jgi:putative toxin-antitoxin system antitoxin component (TIGR02293 family)